MFNCIPKVNLYQIIRSSIVPEWQNMHLVYQEWLKITHNVREIFFYH